MASRRREVRLLGRGVSFERSSARGATVPKSGSVTISLTVVSCSSWTAGRGRLRLAICRPIEEKAGAAGVDGVGGDAA